MAPTAVHSDIVAVCFVVIYPGTFLISPRELLRLCVAIVFFESGEGGRVPVLALGLIAFEDGGGCVALEGFGGGGCEGAVGIVVEEKGDEWAEGWEALFVVSELAVLALEIDDRFGFRHSSFILRKDLLTAPRMPAMGSTADQIETPTKFPVDKMSDG